MKVFRVVTEKDGETIKIPGNTKTEIVQADYRYAAESIEYVFDAINRLIIHEEETVTSVIEEHPNIMILKTICLTAKL